MSTPDGIVDIPHADDASVDAQLPQITDAYMKQRLSETQTYTLCLVRRTERFKRPDADPIIWEHGRRNMALLEAGLMPIVCPVLDESGWAGVGIFAAGPERTREILEQDPGVTAGIFSFEVHPIAAFPGSALP